MSAESENVHDELLLQELDDLFEEAAELCDEDPGAALELLDGAPPELATHPELRRARAQVLWAKDGAKTALEPLLELSREYPDFADAHADLAELYGEIGDEKKRVEQLLRVRELDLVQEQELEIQASEHEDVIVETARRTLDAFPSEFKEKLGAVPILLEERPSIDLVREGFDPRSLGLFEGPDHADHTGGVVADQVTRIVLYTANLSAVSEDLEMLREEVEITVLHEVGHYFGLDEDDMERLGLD